MSLGRALQLSNSGQSSTTLSQLSTKNPQEIMQPLSSKFVTKTASVPVTSNSANANAVNPPADATPAALAPPPASAAEAASAPPKRTLTPTPPSKEVGEGNKPQQGNQRLIETFLNFISKPKSY
jgi:hypothetical protein